MIDFHEDFLGEQSGVGMADQPFFRWMLVVIATIGSPTTSTSSFADDLSSIAWLTGKSLRTELEQPLVASWSQEELRQILTPVSTGRRVSIVLDRRLNPSAEYKLSIPSVTLLDGLRQIASLTRGGLSVTDKLAYIGPAPAVGKLRTLIELRTLDLQSKELGIAGRRKAELLRARTLAWADLESPREILDVLAKRYQFTISNTDLIPHDLWAAAVLPDATLAEALTVVLIQFDLTYRWTEAGSAIELVPIPDRVVVERKYSPKEKPADALEQVQQMFSDAQVRIVGSQLVVQATVDDHENLSNFFKGVSTVRKNGKTAMEAVQKRSFTFSANQPVPIIAVMKKLEQTDIRFDYDPVEFSKAGIDLQQTITLDTKNAPAHEFFRLLFSKAGVEFQFEGQTIKLRPRQQDTKN